MLAFLLINWTLKDRQKKSTTKVYINMFKWGNFLNTLSLIKLDKQTQFWYKIISEQNIHSSDYMY